VRVGFEILFLKKKGKTKKAKKNKKICFFFLIFEKSWKILNLKISKKRKTISLKREKKKHWAGREQHLFFFRYYQIRSFNHICFSFLDTKTKEEK
jgi:hypothetical protein